MTELGSLFYNVRLRDLTDQDLQSITQKLRNIGIHADTASLKKSIEDYLATNPVSVKFDPKISAADIEAKLTGQVIKAEISPLTSNLASAINASLKGTPLNIDTLTIDPSAMHNAVRSALSGVGFQPLGDGISDVVAKSVKTALNPSTPYKASIEVDIPKLSSSIVKGMESAEKRGLRIESKNLRKELEDALKSGVKIGIDPQISISECEKKLQGKVIRAEIVPLAANLRKAIQEAVCNGGKPLEVQIGPKTSLLQRLVTQVLLQQGYMVNISTVTGIEPAIKRALVGHNHLTLTVDPTALAKSIQNSLSSMTSKAFGLEVSKDILRNSINQALNAKPFSIQIAVAEGQARAAVTKAVEKAVANISLKTTLNAGQGNGVNAILSGKAAESVSKLASAHKDAASAAKAHATASVNLGGALGSNINIAGELGSAMTSLYSIHALKNFMSQVVEIGGELEHQKIALETIYGSGSKMEGLYSQIKGLARQSPFGVMELTKNIKQLSAYGVVYNEVYDTAKRLADISAATSVDISRLILAFGKTKNRTFLDGLEAKQFAYANIPIYDALSKKLSELENRFVSVKEVMGRIKKREIGFDMVKEILWDMTDEGGKFYNMQEKLAGSVKTSWKLVRDNIELMFGEIAESSAGSALKWLAERLQSLTKDWRTLASVVTAGAAAFGIYKLALLAANTTLGRYNLTQLQSAAAQNKDILAKTKGVAVYRSLFVEETKALHMKRALATVMSKNILSSKVLSNAEMMYLYKERILTKELALRLIATRKITAAQSDYLVKLNLITRKEQEAAIAASKSTKSFTLLGQTVTLSAARFKLLGAAIWNSVKAIGSFIFNPAMLGLAAISAAAALWSKNSREMEKSKEIGDGIFSKAVDSVKELETVLTDLDPSKKFSDLELSQNIETLEEKIKDFSPTPIEDINNALVAQDGHVNSLTERFEALYDRLAEIHLAYRQIKDSNFGDMISGALAATDGGNWFTSMFNDDLKTNAKDYSDALKRRSDAITKALIENRKALENYMNQALKGDEAFRTAAEGLSTFEAKLKFLAENSSEYSEALGYFDATLRNKITNSSQIKAAYDELSSDTDKFIEYVNSRLRDMTLDPSNLDESSKTALAISLNSMLDQIEGMGEEAKALLARKFEAMWKIQLIPDRIGPAMQEEFKAIVANSTDKALKEAVRIVTYEGVDKLSGANKAAWEKAMTAAKDAAMSKLKLTQEEMASHLAANPLTQTIQLIYTDPKTAPSDLAKQLVRNHGYPGLTDPVSRYVNEWAKSGNIYETRNAAQEALQKAYSELEAAKQEGGEIEKKAQAAYNEVMDTLRYLGWTDIQVKDQKSNKHTGPSKQDPIVEAFRQRFKDLKDAWSEYQKWQKTLGDTPAADKIAESGLFGDMKSEDIPRTAEQYKSVVEKLRSELEAARVKDHSQRESLLNEYIKNILDIDKTIVDERIKAALEIVEKAFEKETSDFNLYEKIRKATGNDTLAYTFSFGLDGGATDYVQLVKDHFRKLSEATKTAAPESVTMDFDLINESNVKDLPDELQKAWREATKNISKYREEQRAEVADMLKEYQSTQEEIIALRAQAADKIRKIETEAADGRLNRPAADNLIGKINAGLDYEVFRRSGEYMKFFNASLSLASSEAESIGSRIKENLDDRLRRGLISAKDYADEMEKINGILQGIQNRKNNFGNFLKGGLNNVFEEQFKKAQDEYTAASTDYEDASERYQIALLDGDEAAASQAQSAMEAAEAQMQGAEAAMQGARSAMQTMAVIDTIVHGINDTVQGIKGGFDLIADMADSFGVDTSADTAWGAAGAFLDAFSQASQNATEAWDSLKSGNVGGVIKGVIGSFTSWFTVFNRWHDAKLQKKIERSQRQFQEWQYIIDSVERRMERFLGNTRNVRVVDAEADLRALSRVEDRISAIKGKRKVNFFDLQQLSSLYNERRQLSQRAAAYREGGALGYERQLMKEQLAELESQKANMEKMKKKDPEAISQLKDQIDEQRQAIREFAEEMAETTYGINLSDWAGQIGDALVDAFSRGEDAAEAFDKTASSIMRSLVSNMITQDIIAPMFNQLREYLFGVDGMSGAYGKDFLLDSSEVSAMSEYLSMIRDEGIPRAQELFDAINAATGGLLDDTESADNSVRAGIQSLSENTGDLLASYLNSIRADVSLSANVHWPRLLNELLPMYSVLAEAQVRHLSAIAENTRRNMIAAEAIQGSVASIDNLLSKATRSKDTGFYIR